MKRLAINYGWILKQHGKKHDIYYHSQKERHWSKELKKGIYNDLVKLITK